MCQAKENARILHRDERKERSEKMVLLVIQFTVLLPEKNLGCAVLAARRLTTL